jgi:hypothetical protein
MRRGRGQRLGLTFSRRGGDTLSSVIVSTRDSRPNFVYDSQQRVHEGLSERLVKAFIGQIRGGEDPNHFSNQHRGPVLFPDWDADLMDACLMK